MMTTVVPAIISTAVATSVTRIAHRRRIIYGRGWIVISATVASAVAATVTRIIHRRWIIYGRGIVITTTVVPAIISTSVATQCVDLSHGEDTQYHGHL